MDENESSEAEYLTPDEFIEQLEGLEPAQQYWLLQQAETFSLYTAYAAEDMLQEAIARTLAGARRLKKGLKVTTYLRNAMRSISSAERAKNPVFDSIAIESDVIGDAGALEQIPCESAIEIGIIKKSIASKFGDSSTELKIIELYLDEWSQKDICELEDLTKLEYEAAMKRVRRYLYDKHSGDPND